MERREGRMIGRGRERERERGGREELTPFSRLASTTSGWELSKNSFLTSALGCRTRHHHSE